MPYLLEGRAPISGLRAVDSAPPPKRSILVDAASFETPMSLLFLASAFCVVAAMSLPVVFLLMADPGQSEGR